MRTSCLTVSGEESGEKERKVAKKAEAAAATHERGFIKRATPQNERKIAGAARRSLHCVCGRSARDKWPLVEAYTIVPWYMAAPGRDRCCFARSLLVSMAAAVENDTMFD